MAKAKMVQWKCPNGCPGVLGPQRPRRDDVRRYCLACSARTGRLVERISPALERKRTTRAEEMAQRRAQRQQRAKDREAAYYTVAGVNLHDEMMRLIKLPCFGGRKGPMARRPPTLQIRRTTSYPRSRLGVAWPHRNTIQVTDYPGIDAADAKDTLLHEITHIYIGYELPAYDRRKGKWHGSLWRSYFRTAIQEGYGIRVRLGYAYHGPVAEALREREKA